MNTAAFQTIWNALLETSVPHVNLTPNFCRSHENTKNNNITFTGLSTNMSMKKLDFNGGHAMSQQNWRNLFLSIQGNKGLEELALISSSHTRGSRKNTEILSYFTEMLRKNNTLIDVQADSIIDNAYGIYDNDARNQLKNVITIETKLNRKWNQYLVKRTEEEEKEEENASSLPAHVVAAAERKRRYKMGALLHAFEKKRMLRDTILFHLLSDTPDLWIDDEVQQNFNYVFRN